MYNRLLVLEENIANLQYFKQKHSLDSIKSEKNLEWALRYGLFESIQIVIDISCHLVSKYNLGNPESYAQCIELIAKYEYIDKILEKNLIGMIGLRNILVHEYIDVDIEKLYKLLEQLFDLRKFITSIKDII